MTEASRQRLEGWAKFAFAAAVTILGAWWVLGQALAMRPTDARVRGMIDRRPPHAELKAIDDRVHAHEVVLGRIDEKFDRIITAIADIKTQLKER